MSGSISHLHSLFYSYHTVDLEASSFQIGRSSGILNRQQPQSGSQGEGIRGPGCAMDMGEVGLPHRLFILVKFRYIYVSLRISNIQIPSGFYSSSC